MARLSDVPRCLRSVGVVAFGRRVLDEIVNDQLFTWAAALAYSWLFAIFPFFIFLLSLLPYLPEYAKTRAKDQIRHGVEQFLVADAARTVWSNIDDNLENLLHQPKGKLLYLGLGVALWAAS